MLLLPRWMKMYHGYSRLFFYCSRCQDYFSQEVIKQWNALPESEKVKAKMVSFLNIPTSISCWLECLSILYLIILFLLGQSNDWKGNQKNGIQTCGNKVCELNEYLVFSISILWYSLWWCVLLYHDVCMFITLYLTEKYLFIYLHSLFLCFCIRYNELLPYLERIKELEEQQQEMENSSKSNRNQQKSRR